MSFEDYQGGFVIDDIEESASMPEEAPERVKINVPAGTGYNVQIRPVDFAKAKINEKSGSKAWG